jgi:hypothetical protein
MSDNNLNDLLQSLKYSISGDAYLGDSAELRLCEDLADKIEQLQKENELLRSGYEEAVVDIESWAAYASDYFKEKWDLEGDLKGHRAILTANRKE